MKVEEVGAIHELEILRHCALMSQCVLPCCLSKWLCWNLSYSQLHCIDPDKRILISFHTSLNILTDCVKVMV